MKKNILILSLILSFFTVFSQEEKKVTLFWDTSYSMIDKELPNEMEFLNSYFKTNTNLTLNLIQ